MRTSARAAAILAIGLGVVAACSGVRVVGTGGAGGTTSGTHSTSSGTGGAPGVCVPGTQVQCVCPGGLTGELVCNADGSAFGPCTCDATTASSSSASSSSSGGGVDAGCAGDPYPVGPYGLTQGFVAPDIALQGFPDALDDGTASVQGFSLRDFYNPGGSEVFPPCSPLGAGKPKPKALVLFFAATWAGPANGEAKMILPAKHAHVAPAGGQFVTVLVDGNTPGTPPSAQALVSWVTLYKVDYPSGIPQATINVPVFPDNVIVDTRTMKVVDVFSGEPPPGSCNQMSVCSTDADCQACAGGACGDGTTCSGASDCAGKTCTPLSFWLTFDALLGLDGG